MWCEAKGASNPSVLTAERFGDKKGVDIAIKTQQSNSLCFAVNPPPFDKGGKGVGDFRGIVRIWKGWVCGNGWCDNPSDSRPNFFGRQHLTFDKGR